jgi:hypothetical protein
VKKLLSVLSHAVLGVALVSLLASPVLAQTAIQQSATDLKSATLTATATGAANTAVTATIAAVTGQCLYVTDIYAAVVANAAVTGAAGPAPILTTTGLVTNLVFWGDNSSLTTGQMRVITDKHYVNPLKVSQSTAFTIVTSAGQSTENVRINVQAYAAAC